MSGGRSTGTRPSPPSTLMRVLLDTTVLVRACSRTAAENHPR